MTPYLQADIQRDEGLDLVAYPDPLTHAAPWTIGYGHTGPNVHPGLVWTQAQAADQCAADIATAVRALDGTFSWWRNMNDARQDVLVNMAFNMGVAKLLHFHITLAAMQDEDYEGASVGMLQSDWADEVGERAKRLSEQMKTGVRI